MRKTRRQLVLTNLVIAECHSIIARRAGREAGLAFLAVLDAPRDQRLVWVDEELTRDAIARWLVPFGDKPLSLTDAVSFEVMRREGIRDVFGFDDDFARVGYRVL